jgi:hypothetical protein
MTLTLTLGHFFKRKVEQRIVGCMAVSDGNIDRSLGLPKPVSTRKKKPSRKPSAKNYVNVLLF